MNNQSNAFEKRAQADINKLKQKYMIDLITAERLKEVLIYLYLSQGSKNQRGINIQKDKLNTILHNCRVQTTPIFAVQSKQGAWAV
jgi:hypothetical protein